MSPASSKDIKFAIMFAAPETDSTRGGGADASVGAGVGADASESTMGSLIATGSFTSTASRSTTGDCVCGGAGTGASAVDA